jgi:hypothetical protein
MGKYLIIMAAVGFAFGRIYEIVDRCKGFDSREDGKREILRQLSEERHEHLHA